MTFTLEEMFSALAQRQLSPKKKSVIGDDKVKRSCIDFEIRRKYCLPFEEWESLSQIESAKEPVHCTLYFDKDDKIVERIRYTVPGRDEATYHASMFDEGSATIEGLIKRLEIMY